MLSWCTHFLFAIFDSMGLVDVVKSVTCEILSMQKRTRMIMCREMAGWLLCWKRRPRKSGSVIGSLLTHLKLKVKAQLTLLAGVLLLFTVSCEH